MGCEIWQDAISAMADGEDPGIAPQMVERHIGQCAACAAYRDDLAATRGALRLGVAPQVPDLSQQIAKANAVADRASRWFVVRAILAVVAAQIIVLSFPALWLGDQTGASPHGARHLGAFTVAYGAGLLVVAVRPARARTLLPMAQVLCAAIGISAVVDVLDGSVGVRTELAHLPDLISLVLLWMLAVPAPRPLGRVGGVRRWRLKQEETGRAASR